MRNQSLGIVLLLVAGSSALRAEEQQSASSLNQAAFVFKGHKYFHRWSKNDQHEFTPDGQEDLEKWSDMITMNVYSEVDDGEGLAKAANAVLDNYKSHQGRVLKTSSVPRVSNRPAEHLIVVQFTRPSFVEVAFARFKLIDGKGCSFVYSHRMYGEKTGDQMSAWLSANGHEAEKALLEWREMPSPKSLRQERL
jgi:hypothetical protein